MTSSSTKMSNGEKEKQDDYYLFGPFRVSHDHVFYGTPLSAAFVNLRPIVPGHVLVMPRRVAPLLADLTDEEYTDLWRTVRVVQDALQKHYTNCQAFNIAVQDGVAAGQSVPHVHCHILPRIVGDFPRNDDVYDKIQNWAPRGEMKVDLPDLQVPEDQDRHDRTTEQMAQEAAIYRSILRG
jgi:bis(5'-adenosyl)-triphosphatase